MLISELQNIIISTKDFGKFRTDTGKWINLLLYVFEGLERTSLRTNQEEPILSMVQSIYQIYAKAAKSNSYLLHLEKLDDWLSDVIHHLFEKRFVNSLETLFKFECRNILMQLEINCPDEDDIYDLLHFDIMDYKMKKNPDVTHTLQWKIISQDYFKRLRLIYEKALQLNDPMLINRCSFESKYLCKNILNSSKITDNIKGNTVWLHQELMVHTLCEKFRGTKENFDTGYICAIKPMELRKQILDEKLFIPRIIQTYYNLLRDLLLQNKLNYLSPKFRFMGVSSLAIEHYSKSGFFPKFLEFHVKYLVIYKDILEQELAVNFVDYHSIKDELKKIRKMLEKDDSPESKELAKFIKKKLKKFKSTKKFHKVLELSLEPQRES